MTIEGIDGRGVNRAKARCDTCGREEVVTCDYLRGSGGARWAPNEGRVKKKLTAHGWVDLKGKLACPGCEAKRKAMQAKSKEPEAASAPPDMSRRQRIEIIKMIAEVYDLDHGRYQGGETDDTVAAALSELSVRPGWVAQVREEEFGPSGGNEDLDAVRDELERSSKAFEDLRGALSDARKRVDQIETDMRAQKERMNGALARLKSIQDALSQRVARKAGVA